MRHLTLALVVVLLASGCTSTLDQQQLCAACGCGLNLSIGSPPIPDLKIYEVTLQQPIVLGVPADVVIRLPELAGHSPLKIELKATGPARITGPDYWRFCGDQEVELKMASQVVFTGPGTATVTASVRIINTKIVKEKSVTVDITALGTVMPPTAEPTPQPTPTRRGANTPLATLPPVPTFAPTATRVQ